MMSLEEKVASHTIGLTVGVATVRELVLMLKCRINAAGPLTNYSLVGVCVFLFPTVM